MLLFCVLVDLPFKDNFDFAMYFFSVDVRCSNFLELLMGFFFFFFFWHDLTFTIYLLPIGSAE